MIIRDQTARQFAEVGLDTLSKIELRVSPQIGETGEEQEKRILSLLKREDVNQSRRKSSAWPSATRRNILHDVYLRLNSDPQDSQHGFDMKLPFDGQADWASKFARPAFLSDQIALCQTYCNIPLETHRFMS